MARDRLEQVPAAVPAHAASMHCGWRSSSALWFRASSLECLSNLPLSVANLGREHRGTSPAPLWLLVAAGVGGHVAGVDTPQVCSLTTASSGRNRIDCQVSERFAYLPTVSVPPTKPQGESEQKRIGSLLCMIVISLKHRQTAICFISTTTSSPFGDHCTVNQSYE